MKITLQILAKLPLWLLQLLGAAVGWLVFCCDGSYRRRLRENVQQAGYSFAQLRTAVSEIGKMFAEQPKIWFGKTLPKVQWQNLELLEQQHQQGKGLLLLTPHIGCFEITAPAIAQHFAEFTQQQPMTVLYRPSRKEYLQNILVSARDKVGLKAVPAEFSGVKQLIKTLRQGGIVGILPDQVPPQGMGEWVPFFGKDAYTMTLHARLAQMQNVAVVFTYAQRLSWGRGFKIHFLPLEQSLAADLTTATAQLNLALEKIIRQLPQQYLWSYNRYKQPRVE